MNAIVFRWTVVMSFPLTFMATFGAFLSGSPFSDRMSLQNELAELGYYEATTRQLYPEKDIKYHKEVDLNIMQYQIN